MIVIGYNHGWKQKIKIGKKNNQKFVQIPFLKLVKQIEYKAQLKGIHVLTVNENHTSKCSFLDNEPIGKHDKYAGKRISRGLFKSSKDILLNAHYEKSIPKCHFGGWDRGIRTDATNNPTKHC